MTPQQKSIVEKIKSIYQMYGKNEQYKDAEALVLKSGDASWNFWFAFEVPEADKEAHLKVVAESKNVKVNYLVVSNMKGVDVVPHIAVILESGNKEFIARLEDLGYDLRLAKSLVDERYGKSKKPDSVEHYNPSEGKKVTTYYPSGDSNAEETASEKS